LKRVKKTYYKELNGHAQLRFQTMPAMINGIIESNRVNIPQYAWLVCLGAFVKSDAKKYKKYLENTEKTAVFFKLF
jgi:hypothetical protein